MNPKVSILLPNLNNRQFLDERLQSIIDQTFSDWELIVIDGYSTDGAWEFFQEWARKDTRIKISQAARQGVYVGLNECVKRAKGEYVYIATSDDTMRPECIENMVDVLEKYPECGICHCCLSIIDTNGTNLNGKWDTFPAQLFFGNLNKKRHIRKAPLTGILHFALGSIHTSLTQLLIRRKIFENLGLFRSDWGSESDFEWNMRTSLITDIIHIPEYLATWRLHPNQLTGNTCTAENRRKLISMATQAIDILMIHNIALYNKLNHDFNRLLSVYKRELISYIVGKYKLEITENRIGRMVGDIFMNPVLFLKLLLFRSRNTHNKKYKFDFVNEYIKELNLENNIVEL